MTTPVDDLIAHEHTDCVCGPAIVPVVASDGRRSDITIHRRLDGLETDSPMPAERLPVAADPIQVFGPAWASSEQRMWLELRPARRGWERRLRLAGLAVLFSAATPVALVLAGFVTAFVVSFFPI